MPMPDVRTFFVRKTRIPVLIEEQLVVGVTFPQTISKQQHPETKTCGFQRTAKDMPTFTDEQHHHHLSLYI